MARAEYWVSVNGTDISRTLDPILISLTITDTDGGQSDQLEIEIDAGDQSVVIPPTGASIQAGIQLVGDDGGASGAPKMFEGKVDKPGVTLARGGGRTMTISAKSADTKGKPKEHKQKHHDKGKFGDVAKKFGKDAGLDVQVGKGLDLERDYWSMNGESFLNWGKRTAAEIGATFKVQGNKAIFAERSAGQSLGGQALATVRAHAAFAPDGTQLGNVISGQLSPVDDRQDWAKFDVRSYDPKKAKYETESVEARKQPGSVTHLDRFAAGDKQSAKKRGEANSAEAERDKGGGSLTIDGDSTVQAEATCAVSGYYPGIDGSYRIKTARHRLTRSAGYTTELELCQPPGSSGGSGSGSGSGGSDT